VRVDGVVDFVFALEMTTEQEIVRGGAFGSRGRRRLLRRERRSDQDESGKNQRKETHLSDYNEACAPRDANGFCYSVRLGQCGVRLGRTIVACRPSVVEQCPARPSR
jgi:hypothetical protein